jgi:hypothetical protein
MNSSSMSESTLLDTLTEKACRREIARLPLTMRPALNQQLNGWADLFPYEQSRFKEFIRGVSRFEPAQLDSLTQPLRALETKMGVAHWSFSVSADTMENASQLARSSYYAEWRREVQRVFAAIESAARESAPSRPAAGRLVLLVLPEDLPITSIAGRKPWDARGVEFRVDGDVRRVCELAVHGSDGLPALLAAQQGNLDAASADCWLIDADARLGSLAASSSQIPASMLDYARLKPFRDEFLAQVNTVPKDIEATDRILARVRHENWDTLWPADLAGQNRLRSFVIELFLSGNGALIFSNAFVQWAASEALRRARPRLLVARFGLRSKPKPFTGIAIFENQQKISALHDIDDPEGSAIDGLILARYIWLSALRYPEQEQTCCVCVAESSRSLYVIAPDAKRQGLPADRPVSPEEVYAWMRRQLLG